MSKSFMNFKKKGGTPSGESLSSKDKMICYVLISCYEPNEEGHMNVEMTYEGDKILASYLIKSAQGMLDKE